MRQILINSHSKALAWCPKIQGLLPRLRERAGKGMSLPERLGCWLWLCMGCWSQREAKPGVGVWSPIHGRGMVGESDTDFTMAALFLK